MRRFVLAAVLVLGVVASASADIVLTIPESVRSEIGGTGTVEYDKIRTVSIRVDPQNNILIANVEIFASSDNAQPAYAGTYAVDTGAATARLEIPGLGFQTGLTLSPPQVTSVINAIDAFRDDVEGSTISFGVVDGTQE